MDDPDCITTRGLFLLLCLLLIKIYIQYKSDHMWFLFGFSSPFHEHYVRCYYRYIVRGK